MRVEMAVQPGIVGTVTVSPRITATRWHDFSAGHRVHGHESKCQHLHGHNYRVHFTVGADKLDAIGRVMDFSVINSRLCMWLEYNYDHKFLVWAQDPWAAQLYAIDPTGVMLVSYNPTAENIAKYLLEVVGPQELSGTGVELVEVVVEETRKCSAAVQISEELK
jgi:6-pyruvoyltetrahydropterin/6-carboxytetrahydropterin synthase